MSRGDRFKIFDPRVGRTLVAIFAVGMLVSLYFLVFGGAAEVRSAQADAFSRSALGHRALVAFLRSSGTEVLISRGSSAAKARQDVPLMVLEPKAEAALDRFELLVRTVIERDLPAVVVLPKWQGVVKAPNDVWVERVELLPARAVQRVLEALGNAAFGRRPAPTTDDQEAQKPRLGSLERTEQAVAWQAFGEAQLTPSLRRPQLIANSPMKPVLSAQQGVLAGWLEGSRMLVIADPDLLNNAGLGRRPNAALTEALLVEAFEARAFIVDEVLHGYGHEATLTHALSRFPFICLSLHSLVLGGLIAWRVAGRFGRPLPPPSRLPPGKLTLIDNTARLLAAGDRGRETLVRYLEVILRRASRRAGLMAHPDPSRQAAALARLARARRVDRDIESIAARIIDSSAERSRMLPSALELHAWYEEMFDGAR